MSKKNKSVTTSFSDRMNSVVSIYQNRYPALFSISMKEAKDEVRFIYRVTR